MVYDQRILLKGNDGLFDFCWSAATKSSNEFKSDKNISEKINITTTCEKLHQMANPLRNVNKQLNDINSVPFRVIFKLYYGTLKIFQYQVNALLNQSIQLLTFTEWDIDIKLQSKRKQCSTNFISSKKRRISLSAPNTKFSMYTELYDESENFVHCAKKSQILSLKETFSTKLIQSNVPAQNTTVKCLQIREMTIREINSDFNLNEFEDDFGVATKEELKDFINFNTAKDFYGEDKNNSIFLSQEIKNEVTINIIGEENPNQSFLVNSSLIENITDKDETLTKEEDNCSNANTEIVVETAHNLEENLYKKKEYRELIISKQKSGKNTTHQKKTTKSKLIIDRCREITLNELRKNIFGKKKQAYQKPKIIKLNNSKKLHNQYDLTTFQSFIPNYTINCQRTVTQEKIANDYQNIVRDILQDQYNENVANEIYSGWNKHPKELQSKRLQCKRKYQDEVHNPNEMEQNILENTSNNNMYNNKTYYNKKKHSEWSPSNLLTKLLEIWRNSADADIEIKTLILSTKSRIIGALAVHSLLTLAASNYIVLTKSTNSIEIKSIKLGDASDKLLRDLQTKRCKA